MWKIPWSLGPLKGNSSTLGDVASTHGGPCAKSSRGSRATTCQRPSRSPPRPTIFFQQNPTVGQNPGEIMWNPMRISGHWPPGPPWKTSLLLTLIAQTLLKTAQLTSKKSVQLQKTICLTNQNATFVCSKFANFNYQIWSKFEQIYHNQIWSPIWAIMSRYLTDIKIWSNIIKSFTLWLLTVRHGIDDP